jgi:hypothetical protein
MSSIGAVGDWEYLVFGNVRTSWPESGVFMRTPERPVRESLPSMKLGELYDLAASRAIFIIPGNLYRETIPYSRTPR